MWEIAAIRAEFRALRLCILDLRLKLRDGREMPGAMMVRRLQSMKHADARTVMPAQGAGIGCTSCIQGQDGGCCEKSGSWEMAATVSAEVFHELILLPVCAGE
jgi:hypothetical protein